MRYELRRLTMSNVPGRMRVAVVKETRVGEKRVLLLPSEVSSLAEVCEVVVEVGAGSGLNIANSAYSSARAQVVSRDIAWSTCDLVVKLKRPTLEELQRLKPTAAIAALFHAESAPEVVDALIRRRITAYSFEYFRDEAGNHPLMAATGEISGQQAVIYAAYHLQSHLGGSGKHLPTTFSESGATIAILGCGHVGIAAARLARAMGARVLLFRWSTNPQPLPADLADLQSFPWDARAAEQVLPSCDVVIGAIRISSFDTPVFVTKSIVSLMRPGSVIVDATAGFEAGYIETSTVRTTLAAPFHSVHGVKHIKIRELPLGVHATAAQQISRIYGPHISAMVRSLSRGETYAPAEHGVITREGRVVSDHVLRHYRASYRET